MNPYDLDTSVILQENPGTLFAKKVYRKRKRYTFLILIWGVLILGMMFPGRNFFPEARPALYIGLFFLGGLAIFCFYFASLQRVRAKLSDDRLSVQERHDYDLALYRKMHKRKGIQRNTFLLVMAKQDLLMEDGAKAGLALAQIDEMSLEKKMLKSYYFFLAAASYLERNERWKIQLEQCLAIPVKDENQSDERIRAAFEAGAEQLLKMVEGWNWIYQGNPKKNAAEGTIMGAISLISALFLGTQMFFASGSLGYMVFSVIGISILSIVWVIWMTCLTLHRIREVREMEYAVGTKKGRKIRYIVLWIVFNICILFLCIVTIVAVCSRRRTTVENSAADLRETLEAYQNSNQAFNGNTGDMEENNLNDANAREENNESNTEVNSTNDTEANGTENITVNPITRQEFEQFHVTGNLTDESIYAKPDNYENITTEDLYGTWYCDEMKESIRLEKDGAYVYIPYLDYYGDRLCEWELLDHSDYGNCKQLNIYVAGRDVGPLVYYINGATEEYFWCKDQAEVFYKQ